MSANRLTLARQSLLEPAGLGETELTRLMGQLMSGSVDYADLYFQYSRHESWSLEEGKVKSGSHSIEQGVGIRAVAGEKTGFAYSDDIRSEALLQSASAARAISREGSQSNAGQRIVVNTNHQNQHPAPSVQKMRHPDPTGPYWSGLTNAIARGSANYSFEKFSFIGFWNDGFRLYGI